MSEISIEIKDYSTVLNLYKALLEAKFHGNPDNVEVPFSPIVAEFCNRLADTLKAIDEEKSETNIGRWDEWRLIKNQSYYWEKAIQNAKLNQKWMKKSTDEKEEAVKNLLSPFTATKEEISLFVKKVEERAGEFQYLDEIIGKPICSMGRAANMLWIGIGEKFATTNWRGEAVEKSTYALHVQTGWRIVREAKKEVLLTAYDMYSPRTGMPYDEDFEWEPQGNNLFDEKCQSWLERELPVYIRRYDINQWGDLTLWLSNEEVLQVFNTSSDDSECWRLFMPGKDRPHLVAYPAKMELE